MSYRPRFFHRVYECFDDWFKILGFSYTKRVSLDSNDSIVLVLDPVECYRKLFKTSAVSEINNLVLDAKLHDVPVIYTNWCRSRDLLNDQANKKAHWSSFLKKQSKILFELPKPSNTINTIHTDAFARSWDTENNKTKEDELIHLIGNKKNIIMCGSWTEACVEDTARAAFHRDLNPIVIKGATTGDSGYKSRLAFVQINKYFGSVVYKVVFN